MKDHVRMLREKVSPAGDKKSSPKVTTIGDVAKAQSKKIETR